MDSRAVAIAVIAFGNFVTACGAFVVVGLLNEISADLNISVAVAGLLGAAFSSASCVLAPVLGILGSRIRRRTLLVGALGVHALGSLGSAIAPNFAALFLMRMVLGGTTGAYVPASVSTAGMMAAPERRGRAIFMIGLGATLAQVLGVPLGVWFGGVAGWRMTLLVFGVLGAVVSLLLWRMVPPRLQAMPFDMRAWGELRRDRVILTTLVISLVQGLGGMLSMTYLAPLLRDSLNARAGDISFMMGVFGFCGVAGTLLGMRFMDRVGPQRISLIALSLILANFLLWPVARGSFALTGVALGLWGAGFVVMGATQQTRMVLANPRLAPVSVAFNTSCTFGGGALGAALGSVTITLLGLRALTWVSAGMVCAALVIALLGPSPRVRGELREEVVPGPARV